MKDKIITNVLLALVTIFFVNNIVCDILHMRELKRHNVEMETIDKNYKERSIEVSEQFNLEVKALGE